ncbi:MAG: ATP-binding cassette domain-containing protein [Acidobacteria bacterium]|nr:ATP-binding cassette domain-containing protein [Acidobacteriota bacterium]
MLTLENISVNYGAIEALRGVSMRVEQGEVITLIGANGAGKTTTLRTITGLLAPREGRVTYEGADISGAATHRLVSRGIAMSPEGRGVFANLSVRENLQMGAYIKNNKAEIGEDLERGFAMFPRLKERESQKAGTAHAALKHSDRAYVMETGRIVMEGPSKDLAADPRIKEAYLGE